jgi:hypothetical protein
MGFWLGDGGFLALVRFLRRSREGGSQRESGGGKEKDVTFFVGPAPKINLVVAHLNRPSLKEKGR